MSKFNTLVQKFLSEGKTKRGVRDGTGPYKKSYQSKTGHKKGKRRSKGQSCPKK